MFYYLFQIYTPSIWYYHKLIFLNNYLQVRKSTSNIELPQHLVALAEEPVETSNMCSPFSPSTSSSNAEVFSPTDHIFIEVVEDAYEQQKEAGGETLTPKQKKRKTNKVLDFDSTAARTLADISNAAKSFSSQPMDTNRTQTDDEVFGDYIGKSLSLLKNIRNKIEAKHKINNIIYEASLNELE